MADRLTPFPLTHHKSDHPHSHFISTVFVVFHSRSTTVHQLHLLLISISIMENILDMSIFNTQPHNFLPVVEDASALSHMHSEHQFQETLAFTDPSANRKPSRRLKPSDWEAQKPHLMKIYHDNTISQIQKLMITNHGFEAT